MASQLLNAYNPGCNNTIGVIPVAKKRILVSWIGHTDVSAMAADLGDAGKQLLATAKISGYGEKPGPVKTAVASGLFDAVHLASNYAEVIDKPFAKWLDGKPPSRSPRRNGFRPSCFLNSSKSWPQSG